MTRPELCPYKPVIFVGGAPGTGKSTLANHLLARLDLDHRIGTGFIRAIVQSQTSREADPLLFSLTFESDDPEFRIMWQARRLQPAVAACVDRARREGTALVVEGSHLVPSVYAELGPDVFAVLSAPAEDDHVARIGGHRHIHRFVSEEGVRRIRQIDEFYRLDARTTGVPVLSGDAGEEDLVQTVVDMVTRRCRPRLPR